MNRLDVSSWMVNRAIGQNCTRDRYVAAAAAAVSEWKVYRVEFSFWLGLNIYEVFVGCMLMCIV